MKSWSQHIIFLTAVLLSTASANVFAQDAGMSDLEILEEREGIEAEKVTFTPGEELRYIPKASTVGTATDSVALQIHDFPMQRAAQKPAEKPNEKQAGKKDESILTFNFLYYIIQKYKLQDIID